MDGFFVTVNCSKIFVSDETYYKIFIDTNKMSIVYELKEWIRFMLDLEECFFLTHEDSVIHELEDIKTLDILKTLEMRPCLSSNCIHNKMEKKLFNKLNLFAYWNEVRVHKLFLDRCQNTALKVSQNQQNYLNINEQSNSFSLQLDQNLPKKITQSASRNSPLGGTPLSSSNNIKENKIQVEIRNQSETHENQFDFKNVNTSVINKDEDQSSLSFFSHNLRNSAHSNSDTLNFPTENCAFSCGNKKQKIQPELKKQFTVRKNQRKMAIPFSLGAFLSDMREKVLTEEFKDELKENQEEKFSSAQSSSVLENSEDKCLHVESTSVKLNKNLLKRKRKRKHRKQNIIMGLNEYQTNSSWNHNKQSPKVRPNHIRFSDTDEAVQSEFIEIQSKSLCNTSKDNFLELQDIRSDQADESVFSEEIHETNKTWPLIKTQVEVSAKSIDQDIESIKSNIEKKQPDDLQQNLSGLELLKEKVANTKICMRFY